MSTSSTQDEQTPLSLSHATDEAIKIVCGRNFHQCLWLPANESHERLRVTFATTTNFSDTTLPVILFCPPMFGGRYLVLHADHFAKQIGVRIICADRPGMGGCTPVAINIRVQTWLETVPVLLNHLGVTHVSIVCHSAGTIYALNTLYHLRDILDPRAPYVGLIAPWVDNAYSRTTLMNLASSLPSGTIDNFANIIKFINQRAGPVASWSGDVVSSTASLFQTKGSRGDSSVSDVVEKYGVDAEIGKAIERLSSKFYFQEDITAANEEAKLCLKKGGAGLWGICEDYVKYAELVRDRELRRLNSDLAADSKTKLRLQVYFAESDTMIGKAGQKYFNECWQQDDNPVDFESAELPETNHETVILDPKKGALRLVFEQVSKLHAQ